MKFKTTCFAERLNKKEEEMNNQGMQLGHNLLSQTQLNQTHILNKS